MELYKYTAAYVDKNGHAAVCQFKAPDGPTAIDIAEIMFADTTHVLMLGGSLSFFDVGYPIHRWFEDINRMIREHEKWLEVEEHKKQPELYEKYTQWVATMKDYLVKVPEEERKP